MNSLHGQVCHVTHMQPLMRGQVCHVTHMQPLMRGQVCHVTHVATRISTDGVEFIAYT